MADYFDDDEKNEPIGFEQDPDDDDFGNGTFIYADGTRKYGSDYETAKKLDRQGKAQITGPEQDPTAPEPSPMANTVEEKVEAEEERAEAPPPAAPALMQPTQPARPLPLASQSRNVQQQQSQSQTEQGSQSNTVSRTGSAVPQEQFEQGQRDLGGAYDRAIRTADDNRFAEAAAISARAGQIEQMARDRETATAAAMAQRDQRMAAVTKHYAEVAQRKPDQNKIWSDKGIPGTMAGALGVLLGGLSAYTMGRENTALKEIQAQKKQNIELQLEDRNSELRQLERELGSLEAAVPVFEARMNDAIKMRLEAGLQDERSQTALRNGAQLMRQLEIEKTGKLQEGLKAYHGTVAQQQAQQSSMSQTQGSQTATSETENRTLAAGRTGGSGQDIERAIKLDKMLEEQGYTREQRAGMLEAAKLPAPGGKTKAEFDREGEQAKASAGDKYSEAEGKAQSAQDAITEFGTAAGLVRGKDGKWAVGDGVVPPGFVESVNPFSSKPIRARLESAVEAYGRFQSGGVIGAQEREAFREQLGEKTGNRQELAERLNAAESTIRARRPRGEREKGNAVPANWR